MNARPEYSGLEGELVALTGLYPSSMKPEIEKRFEMLKTGEINIKISKKVKNLDSTMNSAHRIARYDEAVGHFIAHGGSGGSGGSDSSAWVDFLLGYLCD